MHFDWQELSSFRNVVPFFQAPSAAGSRRMLRDEHRMVPPGRLPPVVERCGGRDAAQYDLDSLLLDVRCPPALDMRSLFRAECELPPKGIAAQTAKSVFRKIAHACWEGNTFTKLHFLPP